MWRDVTSSRVAWLSHIATVALFPVPGLVFRDQSAYWLSWLQGTFRSGGKHPRLNSVTVKMDLNIPLYKVSVADNGQGGVSSIIEKIITLNGCHTQPCPCLSGP